MKTNYVSVKVDYGGYKSVSGQMDHGARNRKGQRKNCPSVIISSYFAYIFVLK